MTAGLRVIISMTSFRTRTNHTRQRWPATIGCRAGFHSSIAARALTNALAGHGIGLLRCLGLHGGMCILEACDRGLTCTFERRTYVTVHAGWVTISLIGKGCVLLLRVDR